MKNLVFFLEEPSAEEMLKGLLPKILSDSVEFVPKFFVFEGKQDLEKRLPGKLRAWRIPNSLFVILRDQDSGDCWEIKNNLADICYKESKFPLIVRIACREIESFYLGDLKAVETGLNIKGLARRQNQKKYREPDLIEKPSQELERITQGGYQKIAGSRQISPSLDPNSNRSKSFGTLVKGIKELVQNN